MGEGVSVRLPENWPQPGDFRDTLAAWVSKATNTDVIAAVRMGRRERGPLFFVRLADGDELFFETVSRRRAGRNGSSPRSCRSTVGRCTTTPSRTSARSWARWSGWRSSTPPRTSLTRTATPGIEYPGCLTHGGQVDAKPAGPDADDDAGKLAVYYAACRYQTAI